MLMMIWSSSKTRIETASPESSCSRHTKPGEDSARALTGSSAAMNSASCGESVGATARAMLICAT
jgi:hypothetical protein